VICLRQNAREKGRRPSGGRAERGFTQHQSGDNAYTKKASNLDEHVAADMDRGKAVPIPVGNVRRKRRQYSSQDKEP